jgi:ABC-2 type transport system permease protein
VATVLTMIFAAVPELIAALISGGGSTEAIVTFHQNSPPTVIPGTVVNNTDFAVGLFVGALVGAVIYNAIFVMVSAATTRAIAVGLLYVLVWEALLSNFVSGARLLSVSHYSLGIANGIAHDSSLNAGLTASVSIVMGVIVTVLALALAVNLLSSFTLKGEPA